MRKKVLLLVIAILMTHLTQSMWASTKRALLIGIQDYKGSDLKSLKGPNNDLELIKQVLINKFDFQENNIIKLMDKKATHTNLETAFSDFAKLIKEGDFVYIHYTGHGSQTPDQNGDEYPRANDQTWVSYGSRTTAATGKDQFDIIDDELFEWLFPIFEKTEPVIFVSDSCHSASVTRGEGPTVRAAPIDIRKYPFGKKPFKQPDFNNGIRIGAVQDIDDAYEGIFDEGKTYGVFTWYWAEVLQQSQPGVTWNDVFKRTAAKVTNRFNSQHPQIQGKINEPVFAGQFKEMSPRIPISGVWKNGKKVRIEVGTLSGITAGSIFRLYNPGEKNKYKLPAIKITGVKPFYSEAIVKNEGTFQIGDLVVEESHEFHFDPVPVFINADAPRGEDKTVINRLCGLFTGKYPGLPGYRLTDNQPACELVLYVLRPKKKNGRFIKRKPQDTLPQSFPGQPPEVWVLNSAERPIFHDLRIPFSDHMKGTELLVKNLHKIMRLKEIKNLTSNQTINVELNTTIWAPVENPGKSNRDYLRLSNDQGWFRRQGIFNPREMEASGNVSPGSLLTFTLRNNTSIDYYIYVIDIMDNGKIKAIFPGPGDPEQDALLPAGRERDLKDVMVFLLDEPGIETIKLIVTERPIDVSLLEQEEFVKRGGVKGSMNALERLLTSAVHGTRGLRIKINRDQWAVQQYSFVVGEVGVKN
jgi:hypothetical protein